jgi:hypothetical protein
MYLAHLLCKCIKIKSKHEVRVEISGAVLRTSNINLNHPLAPAPAESFAVLQDVLIHMSEAIFTI